MTQYLGMPNDNEIMSPTWCTRSRLCSRRYSCRWSQATACELARSGSPRHKPENECHQGKCQRSQWVFYQTSVVRIGSRLTESRPPTMNSFSVWVRSWDHEIMGHVIIPCTVALGGRSSARMPGGSWGHPLASSGPRSWHQMMCRQTEDSPGQYW